MNQCAILQEDNPVGEGGSSGVVGDDDDGLSGIIASPAQDEEHVFTRGAVEVAGRLVS